MGTPQVLDTFLALGEVIYPLRLGFFMYWHRHGVCSFNFWQQVVDGDDDDVKAGRHGDSSVTVHVTAIPAWDPAKIITRIATAHTAIDVDDLIFLIEECKERDDYGGEFPPGGNGGNSLEETTGLIYSSSTIWISTISTREESTWWKSVNVVEINHRSFISWF
ncbi:hypothetical protein L6452_15397 [Arctium lappa]|uniref:Uncharacterized protein n=1 Tax=Arctium lappa TaxID=4217 RepID=A0ACB9CNL6_ARCLA|nr:hypothetical protein L6452_15397 [Arctium lappa]